MGWFRRKSKKTKGQIKPMGQRAFEAATRDRIHNWNVQPSEMDGDIKRSLADMRALARDLEQNNSYIKKYHDLVKNNVVGPKGIRLQCLFKNKLGGLDTNLNNDIEDAFSRWSFRPEVTNKYSWAQVQRLVINAVARDGEAFIRTIVGTDHNKFKFTLQLIDSSVVDESLNEDFEDGRKIRLGVELDEWGCPQAYYLKTNELGDNVINYNGKQYHRLPADQMIHVYMPDRMVQTRGYPWCHPVINDLKALKAYDVAEVTAARIAASKMGFFTRSAEAETNYGGDDLERDEEGNYITSAEPGSFEILPEGVSFQTWNPEHPNKAYKDFSKSRMRCISSGLLVSYNSLANDLEGVNFSSLRSGLLEERERWKVVQESFIDMFMLPVYQRWIEAAFLARQVKFLARDIDRVQFPAFLPRRWAWVDPKKDVESALLSINGQIKSRTEIAAEQGRSIEDVFDELRKEEELIEKYKLKQGDTVIFKDEEVTHVSEA